MTSSVHKLTRNSQLYVRAQYSILAPMGRPILSNFVNFCQFLSNFVNFWQICSFNRRERARSAAILSRFCRASVKVSEFVRSNVTRGRVQEASAKRLRSTLSYIVHHASTCLYDATQYELTRIGSRVNN